ncbi:MAG: hypothetical protein WAU07_00985 [Microgenomates group bacterium]
MIKKCSNTILVLSKKCAGLLFALLLVIILKPTQISAQITNPVIGDLGEGVSSAPAYGTEAGRLFSTYFVNIWQAAIVMGGLSVLIYYIWGAFEWITAGSDAGKVEKGRVRITNATIGLILLVSVFVIVGFISTLLFGEEFQILDLTLPSTQDIDLGPPQGN